MLQKIPGASEVKVEQTTGFAHTDREYRPPKPRAMG